MSERTQPEARESQRLRAVGEEAAHRGAETVSDMANIAAEATQRAAEQGQEAMTWGLRAMSGMAPLGDAGLEQSRRTMEATARIASVYREATERSAEDVQALVASYTQFARGLQQWQHACLDLTQQWMDRFSEKRGDLVRSRSPVELAELQRDLYVQAVSNVFTANTALWQLAGRIAEEAVRPLQERARATARA